MAQTPPQQAQQAQAAPQTADAPEVRDADEIAEQVARQGLAAPIIVNGRPLTRVMGACSDKIPTVQFGNVVIGPVMIERWVDASDIQTVIDEARLTQRAAEYVVGVERRLLQWALDPSLRVQNPVTAQDAFAAPPPGYDPSAVADPRPPQAAGQGAAQPENTPPTAPPAPPPAAAGDSAAQVG